MEGGTLSSVECPGRSRSVIRVGHAMVRDHDIFLAITKERSALFAVACFAEENASTAQFSSPQQTEILGNYIAEQIAIECDSNFCLTGVVHKRFYDVCNILLLIFKRLDEWYFASNIDGNIGRFQCGPSKAHGSSLPIRWHASVSLSDGLIGRETSTIVPSPTLLETVMLPSSSFTIFLIILSPSHDTA